MLRFLFCIALMVLSGAQAFAPSPAFSVAATSTGARAVSTLSFASTSSDTSSFDQNVSDDVVARRIVVKGAVQGGYYRSCVRNEAGRFRSLVGTMSPPEVGVDTAEIYVEGKLKMVDSFIRWCKRGDVGLSQVVSVSEVIDEEPTGMYEEFFCKTK